MKFLVLSTLLTLQLSAHAEDFTVYTHTGRVDIDALNQLNDMAQAMLPFNPEATSEAEIKIFLNEFQARSGNSQFRDDYKKLRSNVEMFLVTNGITFTRISDKQDIAALIDINHDPNKDAPFKLLNKNPILEKVVLDIIDTNAETFFKHSKSSSFYMGKAFLMSAIPIVNVLYMLNRGSGSYYKDLQDQSRKFLGMQVCSLRSISEDPAIQHFQLEENECEAIDQDILKSYKLLVSGMFALGLLIKNQRAHYGEIQNFFAMNSSVCAVINKKVMEPVREAEMNGGWIFFQSFGIMSDTSHCLKFRNLK